MAVPKPVIVTGFPEQTDGCEATPVTVGKGCTEIESAEEAVPQALAVINFVANYKSARLK